jgi:hypothetical protein
MFINSWPQYIKMSFDDAPQYHNLVVSFDMAMKALDGFQGNGRDENILSDISRWNRNSPAPEKKNCQSASQVVT